MMRQTLSVGQYEELQRCAHKLKGAGGSYGYPLLTDACKVLEDAAKLRDESKCSMAIDAVAALSRAIQNGYTTSISSERSQC
jgi:HPt (histidine-containing phosphotransfer) domain-containing protein